MLCADSVQWHLAETNKRRATPCDVHRHGELRADVVTRFPDETFDQHTLNELASDYMFVRKLLDNTGLELYEHQKVTLIVVPDNPGSLLYSVHVHCSCVCANENGR